MTDLARRLAGRFLVIDGPDGAGKSTQMKLLAEWLTGQGVELVVTRDPGGTAIGDRIRQILLDPAAGEMGVECEIMLYMASRAQLVAEVIRPALSRGATVLCDRFVSSTIAYQGAGGADTDAIARVADVAIEHTWPDLTVILDIDASAGLARVKRSLDRMEAKGLEFHARVRQGFLAQAQDQPDQFAVVSADDSPEAVAGRIRELVSKWQFGL